MRIIFLTVFALFSSISISTAQPVSKEMATSYYQNCISKKASQTFSKESQNFLCSCTASEMMDHMTIADIQALSSQDQAAARTALNHMLTKVYAPCMEFPAKDHYYNTCISNSSPALGKNPEKTCGCMADKVASYLGKNGEAVFTDILKRNPNISDPMAALESDKEFQNYIGKQTLACVL